MYTPERILTSRDSGQPPSLRGTVILLGLAYCAKIMNMHALSSAANQTIESQKSQVFSVIAEVYAPQLTCTLRCELRRVVQN